MSDWIVLLIGSLVTYRLSLMTALESGPGRIFRKLRNLPEPKSATREGMSCLHCTSIWWAAPVTGYCWWLGWVQPWATPLYWLFFSGAAIVVHHLVTEDFKK